MSPKPSDLLPIDRLVEVATPYALAVNVPYVVALTAVAAEVAWLARGGGPARRRVVMSAATATAMAAGALLVAVPYTAAFRVLWDVMATVRWEAAASFWQAHPAIAAVAAFVAWDLSGWVYHVIGHRTRIGWAAHQPHHSGSDFDLTLGLRQTWAPFHGLVHHPLLALAGFDLEMIFVCAAFSSCWQVLEHTSLPIRFPRWFSAVVMTPAAHRHHHGRDGAPVNLGPVLTVWDRLAGTWVSAEIAAPTAYGLATAPSANPLRIEAAGWIRLVRSAARPAEANALPGICRSEHTGEVEVLEVVAEPSRRRILDLLRERERTVGDLTDELGLAQPAVSKHLRVLRDAGLVEVRVDGPRRHYRLQAAPLAELDQWLAPYRQFWADRLDALEARLAAAPATQRTAKPKNLTKPTTGGKT